MSLELRTEEIFQAASDQSAFESLSGLMADRLQARSGVLHWRHQAEDQEEVSYSGYFKPEHMQLFGDHFAGDDLWSRAIKEQPGAGRVWNCENLVSSHTYQSSRIYNEWIRPMGDDTFHCLGGVLRMGPIVTELGFHRGRSQPAFDEDDVEALNGHLDAISHLVKIRYRLRKAEQAEASSAAIQDALAFGIVTMNAEGRVLSLNRGAAAILQRLDGLSLFGNTLHSSSPSVQNALATAIKRTAACDGPISALLVPRASGGFYEVSLVSRWAGSRRQVQAFVHDRSARDTSVPGRLRMLYKLTQAEAEIAVALEAQSVVELAQARGTAVDTVRSQVKSISSKLGCHRQSEIVSIVSHLPKLAYN